MQALLGHSELLTLDEPYTGLDVSAHDELTRLLREARVQGTAVIVTAHEVHEIPGADRVVCLRSGTLVTAAPASSRSAGRSTVELRAGPQVMAAADLLGHDGLTLVEGGPDTGVMVLVVADAALDEVLMTALSAGWSVHRVDPGSRPPPEGRGR